MIFPVDIVLDRFEIFLLVLVRMTALFVMTPIFGRANLPNYFKVALSFLLAIIMTTAYPLQSLEYSGNILEYALMISKEMLVGITLGYVSYMIFTGVYLAGQMIDMQIGFGVVSVLDPLSNIQVPVTANLYYILTMMFMLIVNGHHVLVQALFSSFLAIPPGKALFSENLLGDIIRIFSTTFAIGIKISAPFIAAVFLVDIALGIISKTIPQMNIFFVGMPMKIFLGLIILALTMTGFVYITDHLLATMADEMHQFIINMASG